MLADKQHPRRNVRRDKGLTSNRRSRGRNVCCFPLSLSEHRAAFYALMRRNSNVVSGLMTSPFISRSG